MSQLLILQQKMLYQVVLFLLISMSKTSSRRWKHLALLDIIKYTFQLEVRTFVNLMILFISVIWSSGILVILISEQVCTLSSSNNGFLAAVEKNQVGQNIKKNIYRQSWTSFWQMSKKQLLFLSVPSYPLLILCGFSKIFKKERIMVLSYF